MSEVLVLGAGMAGVSAALALQARGRDVALIDRAEPGRETSFGNAGIIQAEAVEPYALPRNPRVLLRMALRLDNALDYHLLSLAGHAGPLWRYFRNSSPARHRAASAVHRVLAEAATGAHAPLIEAAGAEDLIRREGFLQMRRRERDLAEDAREAERLARDYGVSHRLLDRAELSEAEPALRRGLAGAVHWTDAWTCSDPGGLVAAYARLFVERGGEILSGDASTLARRGAGWEVRATGGPVAAREAVVALGPWSPALLAPLGLRTPMVRKRGYHLHRRAVAPPRRPVVDGDLGAVYAPMRAGLRILTGAELAAPEAPPTPRQLRRAEAAAAELFELEEAGEAEPWLGTRPCLPDMLPLAGRAPGQDGLWLHFGHGHQGFTLGPATAEVLARAMEGARDAMTEALDPRLRLRPPAAEPAVALAVSGSRPILARITEKERRP